MNRPIYISSEYGISDRFVIGFDEVICLTYNVRII